MNILRHLGTFMCGGIFAIAMIGHDYEIAAFILVVAICFACGIIFPNSSKED